MSVRLSYWLIFFFFLPGISTAQPAIYGRLQKIKCREDTTQQYASFVPKAYNPENPAALMIFLDPIGRGEVPVGLYSSLADEFSIITAGSYNSKNFNPTSSVESFVAIYNDLVKQYAIDPDRIWVAGFSGGARAAASIATSYPEIKAVIGCGAGFANDEQVITNKNQAYAAVVGIDDMNYSELLDNSHFLDEKKINNILLTFNGGHQWPPVDRLGLAIEWLLSQDNTILPLPTVRGTLFFENVFVKLNAGLLYAAWMDVNQLCKLPAYKIKSDSLRIEIESRKQFNADKEKFGLAIDEEQNCMNDFSLAFRRVIDQKETVDKTIWLQKIKSADEMKNGEYYYRQTGGQRCFDHSTRLCQEYYFRFFDLKEYKWAFKIAEILSFIKPTDPEPYYYLAVSQAANGNKKQCIKWLKQSINRGLQYSNRIIGDEALLTVLSRDEIERIFEKK